MWLERCNEFPFHFSSKFSAQPLANNPRISPRCHTSNLSGKSKHILAGQVPEHVVGAAVNCPSRHRVSFLVDCPRVNSTGSSRKGGLKAPRRIHRIGPW